MARIRIVAALCLCVALFAGCEKPEVGQPAPVSIWVRKVVDPYTEKRYPISAFYANTGDRIWLVTATHCLDEGYWLDEDQVELGASVFVSGDLTAIQVKRLPLGAKAYKLGTVKAGKKLRMRGWVWDQYQDIRGRAIGSAYVTNLAIPGMSGGVVETLDGKAVGVISAIIPDHGITVYTPIVRLYAAAVAGEDE